MSLRVLVSGVLAASIGLPSVSQACSCLPPSLSRSWHESSDTLRVTLVSERTVGQFHYYEAEVHRPFSGCTQPGDRILLESASNQAACGIRLSVGDEWLVTASNADSQGRPDVFGVNLCGYNRPWTQLTRPERDFLNARLVVCPGSGVAVCADGTQPVACLVDPCDVAFCGLEERCQSNDCGGCTAEFYDAFFDPVCTPW